jgi:ATP-dependent 26S proteasome regulatory subunit
VQELSEMLKQAKLRDGRIRRSISAPEPQSFVGSYDTAIRMMEMSVDEVIELSQGEFSQYVEDKWSWHQTFASTTMLYKKA